MPNEMQYFSLVTDKGSEKLVQAVHDGKKVNITKFAIGDGNGQAVTPSAEQEALVHEFYKSEIDSYEVSSDDPKQLIIKCVVPGEVGYYVMREWGLFDEEDTLIAVANTADTTLVPAQSGELFNLDLRAYIQFDNLEFGAVNIVVNSATQEILKEEILKVVDSKIEILQGKVDTLESDSKTFLKSDEADSKYVQQSTLSNYLTLSDAQSNYVKQSRLSDYLTKSSAQSTYAQQADLTSLIQRVTALETTLDGVAEYLESKI